MAPLTNSFSSLLNSTYSSLDVAQQMHKHYVSGGNVIYLPDFLAEQEYGRLLSLLHRAEGVRGRVADRFSCTSLDVPQIRELFTSQEFIALIRAVIRKKVQSCTIGIKRYGHRDYHLIHDSETIGARLEFQFLLMERWHTSWGGHTVYTAMQREPLLMPLRGNGFLLIQKPRAMHSFVQYINHLAEKEMMTVVEGVFA